MLGQDVGVFILVDLSLGNHLLQDVLHPVAEPFLHLEVGEDVGFDVVVGGTSLLGLQSILDHLAVVGVGDSHGFSGGEVAWWCECVCEGECGGFLLECARVLVLGGRWNGCRLLYPACLPDPIGGSVSPRDARGVSV